MSTYYGNFSSETLNSSNWNYSWDTFVMSYGNDSVSTPSTGVSYSFNGGSGNDYFFGDTAHDSAYGGADDDRLFGYSGDDYLSGGEGNDWLNGGSGNDQLVGGPGIDHLDGGLGADYLYGGYNDRSTDIFQFAIGNSNSAIAQADTIVGWDVNYDYIDSSISGTSSNYRESETSATTVGIARYQVEHSSLNVADHVFLYNPQTDTGYLLSDLDRNWSFETGVVINGAGSASDMNYSDII